MSAPRLTRRINASTALLFLLLMLLILTTCSGAAATPPPPVFLKAGGATSAQPLLNDLATGYSHTQPHVSFDIAGGGTQLGLRQVQTGQLDFGLTSWAGATLAADLHRVPLAQDAIAIVTHPDNPAVEISLAETQQLFSGRLLNWGDVGGQNQPVQVISREDGSGTRAAFESRVMQPEPVTPNAIVLPNSRAVAEHVAQNPGSLAYVSRVFVDELGLKALVIQGSAPTLENLKNGSYPLRHELAIVTANAPPPEVEAFVRFAQSPAGRQIINNRWTALR